MHTNSRHQSVRVRDMNVAHIEHEKATSSIKAAKNILDLDRRFSVEFGQTTSMVATAREYN